MEINKFTIIFQAHKYKKFLIDNVILPYKDFIKGYYSSEVRESNKLIGYDIEFISGLKLPFAHKDFIGDITFNKYSIKKESMQLLTEKIKEYINVKDKMILIEIGAMFINDPVFTHNLLELFSTDRKMVIFIPKNKLIIQTISNLDDSFVVEVNKKDLHSTKKALDKWLGNLILRMDLNE